MGIKQVIKTLTFTPEDDTIGPRYDFALVGSNAQELARMVVESGLAEDFHVHEEDEPLSTVSGVSATSGEHSKDTTRSTETVPGVVDGEFQGAVPSCPSGERRTGHSARSNASARGAHAAKDYFFCRVDDGVLGRLRLIPVQNFSDSVPEAKTRGQACSTCFVFCLHTEGDVEEQLSDLNMRRAEIHAGSKNVNGGVFWILLQHGADGRNPASKPKAADADREAAFISELKKRSRSGTVEEWADFNDGDDLFSTLSRIAEMMYSTRDTSRLSRAFTNVLKAGSNRNDQGSSTKSTCCAVL